VTDGAPPDSGTRNGYRELLLAGQAQRRAARDQDPQLTTPGKQLLDEPARSEHMRLAAGGRRPGLAGARILLAGADLLPVGRDFRQQVNQVPPLGGGSLPRPRASQARRRRPPASPIWGGWPCGCNGPALPGVFPFVGNLRPQGPSAGRSPRLCVICRGRASRHGNAASLRDSHRLVAGLRAR
jgi:hypothetical protein